MIDVDLYAGGQSVDGPLFSLFDWNYNHSLIFTNRDDMMIIEADISIVAYATSDMQFPQFKFEMSCFDPTNKIKNQ